MRQVLKKLAKTMTGEISVAETDLEYYSTDGGVFELEPTAIVFPHDTNDVATLVKTVDEFHQLGNDKISLTARGNGTDQGGGPINTGIIVDFMRHMNQILEIGDDYVVVQPGCLYGRLQTELEKNGQYIPAYPASIEICTIGGAVANNSAGEKTVKYGSTRDYVDAVQVVLADGTVTWLHAMNDEQLNHRKSLDTFEGDIFRKIDNLIKNNQKTIHEDHPHVTKDSSGYALWRVIEQDGKFNPAQIIVGSQGTLCFVTAMRIRTIPTPDPNKVSLLVSYYESLDAAGAAAQALHDLEPSALEIVDKNLINLVNVQKPELLKGLLPTGPVPAIVLLCEFDNQDDVQRQGKLDAAQKIIDQHAYDSVLKNTPKAEAEAWKLRRSAAAVMWTIPGKKKALPIIEDGTVPPHKLTEFVTRAYEIFNKYELEIAIWGHAGDADLHMQPFMDLSDKSDRKKLFAMTDEFYAMVKELGGTPAGEHNDSLMRAVYRPKMFSAEIESLFNQVKDIFDPENMLNPHKKVGVDFNYVKKHLRHSYSIESIAKMDREKAQDTIDR
jgi:FAD/FMN-containing dehydrogenase